MYSALSHHVEWKRSAVTFDIWTEHLNFRFGIHYLATDNAA